MGWEAPRYAHIPLIHGADGAKLSKRHGAVSVLEFREQGFLPEALCNYLLRLGWGHGDAEILSRAEAIALFDLDGVGRAASRMDYAKLTHVNGVYLRAADDARLVDDVAARLGVSADATARARLAALMPGLKERAKTLTDLAASAEFLVRRPTPPFPAKAAAQLAAGQAMLTELRADLASTVFEPETLHAALANFAERTGRKLGEVAQPLRAALSGGLTTPPIDQVLAALGREEVLARLARL